MSAVQYLGRTYDILAFRGAKARGDVQLTQGLFDSASPGEVCTGAQKLAQRWALEFLTIRGSMGFHLATRGTDFVAVAKRGRFRSEVDVQLEYNFASVYIRQNLLAEETEDMHPEDRFGSDELLQIVLSPGQLQLRVAVTSLAGDSREVILPIGITPSNLSL